MLEAHGLVKTYVTERDLLGRPKQVFHAVRDVDLHVAAGETLAVVGESGAGKSTLGRLLLRLIEPDAGTVRLGDLELTSLGKGELRQTRRRMQMVFQDPYSSLDPKMTVGDSIAEPLIALDGLSRQDRGTRVFDLLHRVGLGREHIDRFPYELSGGQLQRIAVARAMSTNPELVVCDEPVAALDVSIRAQVLNLLRDVQQSSGVSYVFVSHDLSLVNVFADRIAVMYAGRIIEEGPSADLFESPRHPYTQQLVQSIPVPDPRRRHLAAVDDDLVATAGTVAPSGCPYRLRCPRAFEPCVTDVPPLIDLPGVGVRVACHLYQEPTASEVA